MQYLLGINLLFISSTFLTGGINFFCSFKIEFIAYSLNQKKTCFSIHFDNLEKLIRYFNLVNEKGKLIL